MMNIFLNGESYKTTAQTLAELVAEQELSNKRFAIEINEVLIPKTRFHQVVLVENMHIEIVVAVGGG